MSHDQNTIYIENLLEDLEDLQDQLDWHDFQELQRDVIKMLAQGELETARELVYGKYQRL